MVHRTWRTRCAEFVPEDFLFLFLTKLFFLSCPETKNWANPVLSSFNFSVVYFTPVADSYNFHCKDFILDFADQAVIADTVTPEACKVA